MHQKNKSSRVLSRVLFFISALCFLIFAYTVFIRVNPYRLSFQNPDSTLTYNDIGKSDLPSILTIPSLHITLPIYPSSINNGIWETTDRGVSYLKSTALPGEKGNSVLYGHNWPNILGNLHSVQPGDEISISFSSKKTKLFVVNFVTIVTSDQTHILSQTNDTRLTIYTCTGWFDSKRFVVTATLKI
jgi:LPXTG-site transpeptidase (sortase) family protein